MITIGNRTIYDNLLQGSPKWHEERAKSIGSSEFGIAAGKGKTRDRLITEKIITRATGSIPQSISTYWMDRGRTLEKQAAEWISSIYGVRMCEVGMIRNKNFPGLHSSPDRLWTTGWQGTVVEIKCPSPAKHLKFLEEWVNAPNEGWVPSEYAWQIDVHRVVCEGWVLLCIYNPDCPAQVISWIPPADESVKKKIWAALNRWNEDYEKAWWLKDEIVHNSIVNEAKEQTRIAALIEAAKEKQREILSNE